MLHWNPPQKYICELSYDLVDLLSTFVYIDTMGIGYPSEDNSNSLWK